MLFIYVLWKTSLPKTDELGTHLHDCLRLGLLTLFLFCRHAFATLSFVAETFIFLYVGMDALDIEKWTFVSDRYDNVLRVLLMILVHETSPSGALVYLEIFQLILIVGPDVLCSPGISVAVSAILLGLVMIGRAAFVFPISFLTNLYKKSETEKVSFRQQVSMFP